MRYFIQTLALGSIFMSGLLILQFFIAVPEELIEEEGALRVTLVYFVQCISAAALIVIIGNDIKGAFRRDP